MKKNTTPRPAGEYTQIGARLRDETVRRLHAFTGSPGVKNPGYSHQGELCITEFLDNPPPAIMEINDRNEQGRGSKRVQKFRVPPELAERLRKFAQSENVSITSVLTAAIERKYRAVVIDKTENASLPTLRPAMTLLHINITQEDMTLLEGLRRKRGISSVSALIRLLIREAGKGE